VIQNLRPNAKATTVEGAAQMIPQGPVASQEAISNFVQMLMIFAIPADP
jgi:K+-transporting ATPase A subunit